MRHRSLLVGSLAAAALTACAGRAPVAEGPPRPEVAGEAVRRSAPEGAARYVFRWTLRDGEARFQGEGAARIEAPYRARLDLFGPRGEGYLRAALVGDELRLPAGVTDVPLPPPALLWSVLGVLRPPPDAELAATDTTPHVSLLYRRGAEQWRFRIEDGVVRYAEWEDGERGRQTVEVTRVGTLGRPSLVVYRDWSAFRELTLDVTHAEQVDGFAPDIWNPDR